MPIALIRHGIYRQPKGVPSAWLPHGLTPEGFEQSSQAAAWLLKLAERLGLGIDPVIHSSPMRRSWETATQIALDIGKSGAVKLQVQEFSALSERGVGALANLSTSAIESIIADDPRFEPLPAGWKRDPDFKLPVEGAESLLQAGQRLKEHLLAHTPKDPLMLKLVVGHGGAFRHAAHLLGILDRGDIAQLSMYYAKPIVFQPTEDGWNRIAGDWKFRSSGERVD